jgi:nucleotide-binding universal stress UspA family protein
MERTIMKNASASKVTGILCPVDLSETSNLALKYAAAAAKAYGAGLTVLHAEQFELPPYFTQVRMEELMRQVKEMRHGAEEFLAQRTRKILGPLADELSLSFSVVEEHPVDAVLGWARRQRSDVIVMGTHGRGGASRLWLGSVAENVVRHSEVPVLVVRPRQHEFIDSSHPESAPSLKTILCPVNLTESARATLRIAACIADRFGARLVPLCVLEAGDDRPLPDAEKELHGWVGDTVQTSCPLEMICRKGRAADRINAFAAETQADLVVLGAQRRGSASAWLFGGTTELVLRHAPVPVLVVPDSLPR